MGTLRVNIPADCLSGSRKSRPALQILLCCGFVAALLLVAASASAAQVTNLYGATVESSGSSGRALQAAFDAALERVLVKVTGLPDAGSRATRSSLFADSGAIVQAYSVQPDNKVQVEFDQQAVRKALDRAGLPVWGADRPLVAIWFAADTGGGQRYILADDSLAADARNGDEFAPLRQALLEAADQRGLPVVVPLVDAADMGQVTFADLWGDFRAPVVSASSRYGAEGVLIGRARSLAADGQGVRWTLILGSDETTWQGDVQSGPAEAAVYIARRMSTYANAGGMLRLLVTGVNSLASYGRLTQYLNSLSLIESIGVAGVTGDQVEFDLVVRGDAARLRSTLDTGQVLQRLAAPVDRPQAGRPPDLFYNLPAQR